MNICKRTIQTFILVAAGLSLFAVPVSLTSGASALAAPSTGFADSVSDARSGIDLSKNGSGSGASRITHVVTTLINLLSAIVGIAAVIMIIIGGLKYVTSSGDANNITSAKNTILYAVVGLIVAALARVIVHFVIGAAT